MVAAFKFQDEIALRYAAREAHRAHGGFGAAGDETNFLDGRNRPGNQRGEFDFEFGGDAKTGAAFGLLGDCGADGGIRMAQKDGAPRTDVIEELVAVRVVEVLPFAALDDEGLAAYGVEGADGAVDAADEEFCGAIEDLARAAAVVAVQGWSCGVHSEIEKG